MITLKSVAGKEFYLNCELIYRIDENYDTIITLINGKTLPVANTGEEIVEKIIAYKKRIMTLLHVEGNDSE